MATEVPIVIGIESAKAKQGGDNVVRLLREIRKEVANTNNEVKTLESVFVRSFNVIKQSAQSALTAVNHFKTGLTNLKDSVFSLRTAFAALGIGLIAREFLQAANTTEQYKVRLEVLLGSIRKGNELLEQLTKLAGRIPQTYEETIGAATILSTVIGNNVNEITKWTEITADLSSSFGLSMQETAGQMQRAMSAGIASADLFRERGVSAFLGFQAGVQYTGEETKKKILEAWEAMDSRFRGMTLRLADTWAGTMSMLSDKWFLFRNAVMDSAPFEYLKAGLQLVNENLDKTGQNIQTLAERTGQGMVDLFKKIVMGGARVADAMRPIFTVLKIGFDQFFKIWDKMPPWMQEIGIIAGLLFGVKGAALITGSVAAVNAMVDKVRDFGAGIAAEQWGYKPGSKEYGNYIKTQREARNAKSDSTSLSSMYDTESPESYTQKAEQLMKDLDDKVVKNRLEAKKRLDAEDARGPGGTSVKNPANDNSEQLTQDLDEVESKVNETWDRIADHFEGALSQGLKGFLKTGEFDLQEFSNRVTEGVFSDMADNLAKAITDGIIRGQMNAQSQSQGSGGGMMGGGPNGPGSSVLGGLFNFQGGGFMSSLFGSSGNAAPWQNPDLPAYGSTDTVDLSTYNNGGSFYSNYSSFADGGVITSPTHALMGEGNTPETVLPLKRGKDGKLGIASNGGGGGANVVINQTIVTQDAPSFMRNSGQVAANTANAFNRSMRNN